MKAIRKFLAFCLLGSLVLSFSGTAFSDSDGSGCMGPDYLVFDKALSHQNSLFFVFFGKNGAISDPVEFNIPYQIPTFSQRMRCLRDSVQILVRGKEDKPINSEDANLHLVELVFRPAKNLESLVKREISIKNAEKISLPGWPKANVTTSNSAVNDLLASSPTLDLAFGPKLVEVPTVEREFQFKIRTEKTESDPTNGTIKHLTRVFVESRDKSGSLVKKVLIHETSHQEYVENFESSEKLETARPTASPISTSEYKLRNELSIYQATWMVSEVFAGLGLIFALFWLVLLVLLYAIKNLRVDFRPAFVSILLAVALFLMWGVTSDLPEINPDSAHDFDRNFPANALRSGHSLAWTAVISIGVAWFLIVFSLKKFLRGNITITFREFMQIYLLKKPWKTFHLISLAIAFIFAGIEFPHAMNPENQWEFGTGILDLVYVGAIGYIGTLFLCGLTKKILSFKNRSS